MPNLSDDLSLDAEACLWATAWRGDLRNLLRHLERAGGGSIAVVRGEAERLVGRHWDRIMWVAMGQPFVRHDGK
jgi:hypothetical protein